jgi:hypothetical protein
VFVNTNQSFLHREELQQFKANANNQNAFEQENGQTYHQVKMENSGDVTTGESVDINTVCVFVVIIIIIIIVESGKSVD